MEAYQLNWGAFEELTTYSVVADLHCVSGWTRLANYWRGVQLSLLLALSKPNENTKAALIHAADGYSASLPFAALLDPNALIATHHDDFPLEPAHGGPARLVLPSRYGWKSVKWVVAIEMLTAEQPGYWEQRGYDADGDPWHAQESTRR